MYYMSCMCKALLINESILYGEQYAEIIRQSFPAERRVFMNDFLQDLGILNSKEIYRNLEPARLVEKALARGEGGLSSTGALVVETGK